MIGRFRLQLVCECLPQGDCNFARCIRSPVRYRHFCAINNLAEKISSLTLTHSTSIRQIFCTCSYEIQSDLGSDLAGTAQRSRD